MILQLVEVGYLAAALAVQHWLLLVQLDVHDKLEVLPLLEARTLLAFDYGDCSRLISEGHLCPTHHLLKVAHSAKQDHPA